MENECISYNFRQFAIFVPKNYQIWWKSDVVITKIILLVFRDTVYIANSLIFVMNRLLMHVSLWSLYVHTVASSLSRPIILFTMPWLNISNRICNISSALYIDIRINCLRRAVVLIGLFAICNFCIMCVLLYF